jgi:hypothetical protein
MFKIAQWGGGGGVELGKEGGRYKHLINQSLKDPVWGWCVGEEDARGEKKKVQTLDLKQSP